MNKPSKLEFKVRAGKKTYEGVVNCPDDDGTTTLPMMVKLLVKLLADEHPYLHTVKNVSITASLMETSERER